MFSETLASVQKISLLGFEVMIKATGWADLNYHSLHKISHATNKDGDTSAWVNLLHGFTLNNNQAVFAGEKAYNLAISN